MKLLEALKSINYKDVMSRALWTALQAFLAVVIVGLEPILDLLFTGDWAGLYALSLATVLAGLSAAISAIKTIIVGVVSELKKSV